MGRVYSDVSGLILPRDDIVKLSTTPNTHSFSATFLGSRRTRRLERQRHLPSARTRWQRFHSSNSSSHSNSCRNNSNPPTCCTPHTTLMYAIYSRGFLKMTSDFCSTDSNIICKIYQLTLFLTILVLSNFLYPQAQQSPARQQSGAGTSGGHQYVQYQTMPPPHGGAVHAGHLPVAGHPVMHPHPAQQQQQQQQQLHHQHQHQHQHAQHHHPQHTMYQTYDQHRI